MIAIDTLVFTAIVLGDASVDARVESVV